MPVNEHPVHEPRQDPQGPVGGRVQALEEAVGLDVIRLGVPAEQASAPPPGQRHGLQPGADQLGQDRHDSPLQYNLKSLNRVINQPQKTFANIFLKIERSL